MTEKQWKMLEILDDYGGQGHAEVELQWGDHADYRDHAGEGSGFWTNRLAVSGLIRGLSKKGLAENGENGYDITERGLELLKKRRDRLEKTKGGVA